MGQRFHDPRSISGVGISGRLKNLSKTQSEMTAQIRLGTSSFTADGWNGAFYPKGMKSAEYLGYYSRRFDTVEVDSTFYRCPTVEAVRNWVLKTPPGFIFSLKIPQTITHQKILSRLRQSVLRSLLARHTHWARNCVRWFSSSPFFMTRYSQVMCSSSRDCKPSSRSCRAWEA